MVQSTQRRKDICMQAATVNFLVGAIVGRMSWEDNVVRPVCLSAVHVQLGAYLSTNN